MPQESTKENAWSDQNKDKINKKMIQKDIRLGIFCNTQKGVRPYMSTFDDSGITVAVPRPFYTATSVIWALWISYDDLSQNTYTPEISVGGVLAFDIFNFPELPKK